MCQNSTQLRRNSLHPIQLFIRSSEPLIRQESAEPNFTIYTG
jgi:hypothetical protein